jgi:NitT/TauT family transport system substrate-binding protein
MVGRRMVKRMLRRRALGFCLLAISLVCSGAVARDVQAADLPLVRVGALNFGTLAWELDVIEHRRLDAKHGVELRVVALSGKDGAAIGLQSGSVDAIVTDWLWVSRERAEGADYTFVPHSLAVGAIYVRPDAKISTLADLAGRKLGVAGGPVDKSWLLLRAYSRKLLGRDLADSVDPVYGAPPLLNELMLKGDLPAVLNFWQYDARLRAAGMTPLIGVADAIAALGVETVPPILGWVFSEKWAAENATAIAGLLNASLEAKGILLHDDSEWERIRPLTGAENEATFVALRDEYRKGIPASFDARRMEAAERVYAIIAAVGGKDLVGESKTLSPGTFWSGFNF